MKNTVTFVLTASIEEMHRLSADHWVTGTTDKKIKQIIIMVFSPFPAVGPLTVNAASMYYLLLVLEIMWMFLR